MKKLLGINIDHIATLRNVRGANFPNLMRAVEIIHQNCDVEYLTIHLREDRRHINDNDAKIICKNSPIKVNLEIACTDEMVNFAIENKPHSVCFVPEKRQEMTTESGLNLFHNTEKIANYITKLQNAGITVSLFLDPISNQINLAKELNADVVEIHTGKYANASNTEELNLIYNAAKLINKLKIQCHAGHGITYENIKKLAEIQEISSFHIGHFLICEAVFVGLANAINQMSDILKK